MKAAAGYYRGATVGRCLMNRGSVEQRGSGRLGPMARYRRQEPTVTVVSFRVSQKSAAAENVFQQRRGVYAN